MEGAHRRVGCGLLVAVELVVDVAGVGVTAGAVSFGGLVSDVAVFASNGSADSAAAPAAAGLLLTWAGVGPGVGVGVAAWAARPPTCDQRRCRSCPEAWLG